LIPFGGTSAGGTSTRYNYCVRLKNSFRLLCLITLLAVNWYPTAGTSEIRIHPRVVLAAEEVTAYDLIVAMNTMRASYGNRLLVEDPIINAVAQSTAEIMAANQMSTHIGDIDGRLAAAGYGGGGKVWATENFAAGGDYSIDEIMLVWADEAHMLPATNPAYCHVGAGIAEAPNGLTYYILQAAYVAGESCGKYTPPDGGDGTDAPPAGVPQIIVPVKIATPDKDGKVFHVVEAGQSLWAIAIAYKITVRDLEIWNNISKEWKLQIGKRLFIPGSNTEGYATPTPVGMVQLSPPDSSGKIVHTVQAYQTLTTIGHAYEINIDRILALNGIQTDAILSIGQKLLIDPGSVTPSATPHPLTAIEKLTPESDGKYYHVVESGETLSWIAQLYEINVTDLMAWNGLNAISILQPEQKLILQVTPPATITQTPAPATVTPTVALVPPTATSTPSPTNAPNYSTPTSESSSRSERTPVFWFISIGLVFGGLLLVFLFFRRKQ